MNITLTGNLGSGKSSICRILKEQGFGIISGGDLFRGVAMERGISVIELNELAKKDRSIDDMIDARSTRLGDELDNQVFDSRLAWHFVRESFKVFLLVDTDEAARRVFAGDNRQSEEYASIAEAAEGLSTRAVLEMERFKMLYDIDYYKMSNYDLVIESTNATPEQIAAELLRQFALYKQEKFTETKILLNLRNMYPMTSIGDTEDYCREKNGVLCAKNPVVLSDICGYNYIAADQEEVIREIAGGRIFGEVKSFEKGGELPPLTEEDYRAVEKVGDFSYRTIPGSGQIKHAYMMDLSK